jgi:bifunctional DNA-binding transcriptional regulator/antitoxin component of YhaV-PrlF toxin-antitoxin module
MHAGRLTIPIEFRRALGIEADSLLQMTLEDRALRFVPLRGKIGGRNSARVNDLCNYFAPLRDEIAASGYSEKEVNSDIEAAICTSVASVPEAQTSPTHIHSRKAAIGPRCFGST